MTQVGTPMAGYHSLISIVIGMTTAITIIIPTIQAGKEENQQLLPICLT